MPATAEQLKERKGRIGASDVAAILGVSRWSSAYDVWLEKTGQIEDENESDAAHAGNMFEEGVLNHFRPDLPPGIIVGADAYRERPDLHLGALCDSIIHAWNVPADVKTSGLFGPLSAEWGEPGTDEIPTDYVVQLHAQMICCDEPDRPSPYGLILAFLGGRGFCRFKVERDPDLCAVIEETLPAWWERHVVGGEEPANSQPTERVLKRIRREPGSTIEVPSELVAMWRRVDQEAKEMTKRADEYRTIVKQAMRGAERGDAGDAGVVTISRQSRAGFDAERFKIDHPDLYADYRTESSFPVMRWKAAK